MSTNTFDFRVFLVPGNKTQSTTSIKRDMHRINEHAGPSAIVFNTEREAEYTRKAVSSGLGKGWTRVFENENTIAYGSNWSRDGKPHALLLAKNDPFKSGVSPSRHLNSLPLKHKHHKEIAVVMKGTHLLSEANCQHTKVRARAWREKMYPVQIHDVLEDVARDHKKGLPIVLAGDFNTGIHFTGHQLFAKLKKRFGEHAVLVHNGHLDQIFLINTDRVKLSEVGTEIMTNNASDHDMVQATIRATVASE